MAPSKKQAMNKAKHLKKIQCHCALFFLPLFALFSCNFLDAAKKKEKESDYVMIHDKILGNVVMQDVSIDPSSEEDVDFSSDDLPFEATYWNPSPQKEVKSANDSLSDMDISDDQESLNNEEKKERSPSPLFPIEKIKDADLFKDNLFANILEEEPQANNVGEFPDQEKVKKETGSPYPLVLFTKRKEESESQKEEKEHAPLPAIFRRPMPNQSLYLNIYTNHPSIQAHGRKKNLPVKENIIALRKPHPCQEQFTTDYLAQNFLNQIKNIDLQNHFAQISTAYNLNVPLQNYTHPLTMDQKCPSDAWEKEEKQAPLSDEAESDDESKENNEEAAPIWEELEFCFNLPFFQAMNENERSLCKKKIEGYIKNNKRNDFIKFLKEKDPALSNYLKESDYQDIPTLVSEIFENKVEKDESLLSFLKKKPAFFKDKMLHYNLANKRIHGRIESAKKRSKKRREKILILEIKDGKKTRLEIEKKDRVAQIQICETQRYSLFPSLVRDLLTNKTIEIESKKKIDPIIKAGRYTIYQSEKSKKNAPAFTLVGKETTYQIGFNTEKNGNKENKITKIFIAKDDQEKSTWIRAYPHAKIYKEEDVAYHIHSYIAHLAQRLRQEIIPLGQFQEGVKVSDDLNPLAKHLIKKSKIEREKEALIEALGQEKMRPQLLAWSDALINQKLSQKEIQHPFLEEVKDLQGKYLVNLGVDKKIDDLLGEIVEKALLQSFLRKEKMGIIEQTMGLLRESHRHTEKIKKQEIILLLGPTGAGKSTSCAWLLGKKMKTKISPVGDRIVEIDDEKGDEYEENPLIGHALSISKTLYPRSYVLPKKSLNGAKKEEKSKASFLVDGPGFEDTRGAGYDLVCNTTIDQSILYAKHLKSIILVVPCNAFLIDRCNRVYFLIQRMREKFPKVFETSSPQAKFVHLFITKSMHVNQESIDSLKNGRRLSGIISELEEKISEIREEEDPHTLHTLRLRKGVFEFLEQVQKEKRMHFVDIENRRRPKKILEKIEKTKGFIEKDAYKSSLEEEQLARLKDMLCSAFDTWRTIFETYLELDDKIKEVDQRIQELKESIGDDKNQIQKVNGSIKKLKIEAEKSEKKPKKKRNQEEKEQNPIAIFFENEKKETDECIKKKSKAIQKNEAKEKNLVAVLVEKIKARSNLKNDLNELANEDFETLVWSFKPKGNEKSALRQLIKKNGLEKAHQEGRFLYENE